MPHTTLRRSRNAPGACASNAFDRPWDDVDAAEADRAGLFDFDRVLEHGRVAEHGTFDELMRPDADGPGLLRRMYLVQSEQYRLDGPAAPPTQQGRRGSHEWRSPQRPYTPGASAGCDGQWCQDAVPASPPPGDRRSDAHSSGP